MQGNGNISHIPNPKERDFFRVDGHVYFHYDLIDHDQGLKNEANVLTIPPFSLEQDDFVGLSIDTLREQIIMDEPPGKDYFLRVQQVMAMMKRYFDAEVLGKRCKTYQKMLVNISGSGMAFPSDMTYQTGQMMRLSLFFPRFPYSFVCVVARVAKCKPLEKGFEVAVHFEGISDRNQDEILRFVNQCQRDHRLR